MWVMEHLGVGGAPLRLETAVELINELRELAEDLYSAGGHNRYATALSKAADELASLERYRTAYNEWADKTEWVQADTTLPAKYLGMHRADVLKDMISELFDRLEAAESTRRDDYQNWMTALDRNAELLAKLEAAKKERATDEECIADLMADLNRVGHENDALRAKIERMERQKPVAWMCSDKALIQMGYKKFSDRCEGSWDIPVFAGITGAQGEEK